MGMPAQLGGSCPPRLQFCMMRARSTACGSAPDGGAELTSVSEFAGECTPELAGTGPAGRAAAALPGAACRSDAPGSWPPSGLCERSREESLHADNIADW